MCDTSATCCWCISASTWPNWTASWTWKGHTALAGLSISCFYWWRRPFPFRGRMYGVLLHLVCFIGKESKFGDMSKSVEKNAVDGSGACKCCSNFQKALKGRAAGQWLKSVLCSLMSASKCKEFGYVLRKNSAVYFLTPRQLEAPRSRSDGGLMFGIRLK